MRNTPLIHIAHQKTAQWAARAAFTSFQRDLPGCQRTLDSRSGKKFLFRKGIKLLLRPLAGLRGDVHDWCGLRWLSLSKMNKKEKQEPRRGGIMKQPIMPPLQGSLALSFCNLLKLFHLFGMGSESHSLTEFIYAHLCSVPQHTG